MKKLIGILCVVFALVWCWCSCSNDSQEKELPKSEESNVVETNKTNEEPIQSTNSAKEEKPIEYITYENAFSYVKQCEENIIKSNAYNGVNKYGENAAEKIVYSDEYAGLYCAIWSALEEIGTPEDSRYGKSKLRWQIDFTNEEWKKQLIQAYNEGGKDAFYSKYADIYNKEVFPVVNSRWKAEQ